MRVQAIRLGDIATVYSGTGFPLEFQGQKSGDVPFAKVGDISRAKSAEGRTISRAENYVSREVLRKLKAKVFPEGSIVFAKIGEAIRKNNRCITTAEMAFDNNVMGIDLNKTVADVNYVYQYLNTVDFHWLSNSTTVPSIRKTDMENLEIPLPPLEEQKRIAAILDQADALRCLRARALDRLNSLGQAIFHDMFGEFLESSKKWPSRLLGDCIESGKIGLVRGADEQSDERPVNYLRMDAIGTDGSLNLVDLRRIDASPEELREFNLQPGDLLFNTRNSRELVGKTAVVRRRFDGVYNNNILRLRMKRDVNSSFLDAYFRTPAGRSALEAIKSGTTSVFAIYQKTLLGLTIPVPPQDMQLKFAELVDALAVRVETCELASRKSTSLFMSLQSRAFRSEL